MPVDLRQKDLETLQAIFRHFPSIQSVRIFGSRALGGSRRASDIDLAVFAPDMADQEWSDLREALDVAPLIYGLDVIRMETLANEKLRERIVSDGVEIFAK